MQNYSQTFFQTEISNVIFAVVFAICCIPLHFVNWNVQKEREINSTKNIWQINFYSKKITIIRLTIENLKMYEKRLS